MPNSSIQIWLQRQIALRTFPPNREDWYVKNGFGNSEMSLEERFASFVEAIRQEDSPYHEQLSGIDFQRFEIEVTLANQKTCMTEVIGFQNNLINQAPHLMRSSKLSGRENM